MQKQGIFLGNTFLEDINLKDPHRHLRRVYLLTTAVFHAYGDVARYLKIYMIQVSKLVFIDPRKTQREILPLALVYYCLIIQWQFFYIGYCYLFAGSYSSYYRMQKVLQRIFAWKFVLFDINLIRPSLIILLGRDSGVLVFLSYFLKCQIYYFLNILCWELLVTRYDRVHRYHYKWLRRYCEFLQELLELMSFFYPLCVCTALLVSELFMIYVFPNKYPIYRTLVNMEEFIRITLMPFSKDMLVAILKQL